MYLFNFGEDPTITNKENDEEILNILKKLSPTNKKLAIDLLKVLAKENIK